MDGPWTGGSNLPPPPARPPTSIADQAELDALLDKMNDQGGVDALTSAEKKRLNELSKRLRKG